MQRFVTASSDERALAGHMRRGVLPSVACYCRHEITYAEVRKTVWSAARFPGQRLSRRSASGAGWGKYPQEAWCNEIVSGRSWRYHPPAASQTLQLPAQWQAQTPPDGFKTLDDITFVLKHSVHGMDMEVPSYCTCSWVSVCHHSIKHTGSLGRSWKIANESSQVFCIL